MTTSGLLFIPDISGFTRFVTETEIDHSRRIIQELLEVVIDADGLGLQVSEVEGDAVLFFRFGECPDPGRLYAQVERTFKAFHERLAAYELRRFCQCRACVAASSLTLKIVTHYGEFASYNVRSFEKLIGRGVIVAHQLLKNDVDQREYWLVTSDLLDDPAAAGLPEWLEWRPGVKRTEDADIAFRYAALSELRGSLAPPPLEEWVLSDKVKVISVSRTYAAHIIPLFHASGDFKHRHHWQEGVRAVEEVSHHLPRVGMRCRRVMENGESTIYASSYSFRPDRIEFSETDEGDGTTLYYTLESAGPLQTRLTVACWVPKGLRQDPSLSTARAKAMKASLERSLENLEAFLPQLDVPVEY
jgi:hypothetical protein